MHYIKEVSATWQTNTSPTRRSAHFSHPQETFLKLQLSVWTRLSQLHTVLIKGAFTYGSCRSIPLRVSKKAFEEALSFSSCQGQDWQKQYITLLTKFTFLVLSCSLLPVHCNQGTCRSMQRCLQAAPFYSHWNSTLQQSCRLHFFVPEVFITWKYFIYIWYFPLLKDLQVDMSIAYIGNRKKLDC